MKIGLGFGWRWGSPRRRRRRRRPLGVQHSSQKIGFDFYCDETEERGERRARVYGVSLFVDGSFNWGERERESCD